MVAVIDIDAPGGSFVHWVLYNIPPNTSSLPSGVPRGTATPYGLQAVNDFGFSGYGGPCPPPGKPHRYIFYVLALNATIDLPGGSLASEVLSAARGHVVAYGELVGLYGR
jgi:Raf kinase inhibitor-like YbhB/YbcL family protein